MADNTTTILSWVPEPEESDDGTGSIPIDGGGKSEGDVTLEQIGQACLFQQVAWATIDIRAFVSPSDLNFQLVPTLGTLSAGVVSESEESETIDFKMSSKATTRKKFSSPTTSWEGPVLSESGAEITPPPGVVFDGEKTFTTANGKSVYGTLNVSGTISYITYLLTLSLNDIDGRSKDEKVKAVAIWSGGGRDLVLTVPECNTETETNPDDDKYICWKRVVTVDPCTGEITSDTKSQMPCSEAQHSTCSERTDT